MPKTWIVQTPENGPLTLGTSRGQQTPRDGHCVLWCLEIASDIINPPTEHDVPAKQSPRHPRTGQRRRSFAPHDQSLSDWFAPFIPPRYQGADLSFFSFQPQSHEFRQRVDQLFPRISATWWGRINPAAPVMMPLDLAQEQVIAATKNFFQPFVQNFLDSFWELRRHLVFAGMLRGLKNHKIRITPIKWCLMILCHQFEIADQQLIKRGSHAFLLFPPNFPALNTAGEQTPLGAWSIVDPGREAYVHRVSNAVHPILGQSLFPYGLVQCAQPAHSTISETKSFEMLRQQWLQYEAMDQNVFDYLSTFGAFIGFSGLITVPEFCAAFILRN